MGKAAFYRNCHVHVVCVINANVWHGMWKSLYGMCGVRGLLGCAVGTNVQAQTPESSLMHPTIGLISLCLVFVFRFVCARPGLLLLPLLLRLLVSMVAVGERIRVTF